MTAPIHSSVRVLIVDDSPVVRHGIRFVVESHRGSPAIAVTDEVARAADVIAAIRRSPPQVVLLDIRLPDGSGIDVCREISRDFPEIATLMLTSYSGDALLYDSVVAGAKGYLMKDIDPNGLCEAIKAAARGETVQSLEITSRLIQLLRSGGPTNRLGSLSSLSPQELRVLALVAEGQTNRAAGEKLGLSENTVRNYLVGVFKKLKVKNRSQAVSIYIKANQSTVPEQNN